MTGYAFHPEVRADLDEIWDYIAVENLDAADRVIAEIFAAIRDLVRSPGVGHAARTSPHDPCASFWYANT
jgi:plasmid stabilization system protein ParE